MSHESVQDTELLNYIPEDDGYTLSAFIREVPRIHTDVRFRYRPTDSLERAEWVQFRDRNGERVTVNTLAAFLCRRISEWSLMYHDAKGTRVPMPIEHSWLLQLKPGLLNRMFNIVVWGLDGGDLDPQATAQVQQDSEDVIAAMLGGKNIADEILGNSRKN